MYKLMIIIVYICMISSLRADTVDIEDGIYHSINDSRYQNDFVTLDGNIVNNPGTHLELVDDGSIYWLTAKHNSLVTISGGLIGSRLVLYDESNATMNNGTVNDVWTGYDSYLQVYDGTITYGVESMGNSNVIINGGTIGRHVEAWVDSTIEIHGGLIDENLMVLGNGKIYLYGSDFSVGGQNLSSGDSLRNYGTISGNEISGTITGTLQNGSQLNNTFSIYGLDAGCDIIIIPEPVTLVLFGLGVTVLRRKNRGFSFPKKC